MTPEIEKLVEQLTKLIANTAWPYGDVGEYVCKNWPEIKAALAAQQGRVEQAIRFALGRAITTAWDWSDRLGGFEAQQFGHALRNLAPALIEEWNKRNAAKLAQASEPIGRCGDPSCPVCEPAAAAPADDLEMSSYEQMVAGNHSIGVFKNGKLIAADADVYVAAPAGDDLELPEEPEEPSDEFISQSIYMAKHAIYVDQLKEYAAALRSLVRKLKQRLAIMTTLKLPAGGQCAECGFRYWEYKGHIIPCPLCRLAEAERQLKEKP